MKDRSPRDMHDGGRSDIPGTTPAALDAGTLFRHHARFVAAFVMRLGAHLAEVDDLVQETFMIAHRKGGYVSGPARPTTWLADIALRLVANRRRRRQAVEFRGDTDLAEVPTSAAGPSEILEEQRALARVHAALETLEIRKRAVFVLYELEGESCESIAAGLGVPVGTVYSRLHKARREFIEAYGRHNTAPKARHGQAVRYAG